MYNIINEESMTIFLEKDLVAPNVPGFNDNIKTYSKDISALSQVVLSLETVNNIDSIGVTFVIGLYKKVTKLGVGFKIHDASANVKQLFKLMKLDDLLE